MHQVRPPINWGLVAWEAAGFLLAIVGIGGLLFAWWGWSGGIVQ